MCVAGARGVFGCVISDEWSRYTTQQSEDNNGNTGATATGSGVCHARHASHTGWVDPGWQFGEP